MLPCWKNEKIKVMLSMRNIGLLIKSLSGSLTIVLIVITVITIIHSHRLTAEGRELPKQQISSYHLGTNYEGARSDKCSESDHFQWGVNGTCLSCNSVCDNIMVPYNNDKFCLDNCPWRKCHPVNEFYHPPAFICLSCSSVCISLTSEPCINFCSGYRAQFTQHDSTGTIFSKNETDNSQGSTITDRPALFTQHNRTVLTYKNTPDQNPITTISDQGKQRTSKNIIVDATTPDNSQTITADNNQGTYIIAAAVIVAFSIIISVICCKNTGARRRWLRCKGNNDESNNDEEDKRLRQGQQNLIYRKGIQETGVQGNTFITKCGEVSERSPLCTNDVDVGNTVPKSVFDEDERRQSGVSEECSYEDEVKVLSRIRPVEESLIQLRSNSVE